VILKKEVPSISHANRRVIEAWTDQGSNGGAGNIKGKFFDWQNEKKSPLHKALRGDYRNNPAECPD